MNYRISDISNTEKKNIFPAAIQDVRCAVKRFRSDRYPKLPVDKNHIVVAGESAGGNIGLILASLSQQSAKELQQSPVSFDSPDCEYNAFSADIQGAVSIAGPVDLVETKNIFLRNGVATYQRPLDIFGSFSNRQYAPEINLVVKNSTTSTSTVQLEWTTKRAVNCVRQGDWTGDSRLEGSEQQILDETGPKTFTLQCSNLTGTSARSVTAMSIHTSVNYLGVQPSKNIELAKAASPYYQLQKRSPDEVPPLLLIHGTNDVTVPIKAITDLIDRVLKPKKFDYEFIKVPNAGHDLTIWRNKDVLDQFVDFVQGTKQFATNQSLVSDTSYVEKQEADTREGKEKVENELASSDVTYKFSKNISPVNVQSNDSAEVTQLEKFLNQYEGEKLAIDGVYGSEDIAAVKRFQLKYAPQVLRIWNLTEATGYIGLTTRLKINSLQAKKIMNCPVFKEYNGVENGVQESQEITRTQEVLSDMGFYNGSSTGKWDAKTTAAIVTFQETFKEVMLNPWNLKQGTGYKYKTTNAFLNYIVGCETGAVDLDGAGKFNW